MQEQLDVLALGQALADGVDHPGPLGVVGGVGVEELRLAAHVLDGVDDALGLRQGGPHVQVDAEDVHAGARQLQSGASAMPAGGAQDERPPVLQVLDHDASLRMHCSGSSSSFG